MRSDAAATIRSIPHLGMRLLLAAELGLFGLIALAIGAFRALSPETFFLADRYLATWPAAVLTILLISSGFAMALAGRASRLGQDATVTLMLLLALFGGIAFSAGQIKGLADLQRDLPWQMIVDLEDRGTLVPAHGRSTPRAWETPTPEKSFLAPSALAPTGLADSGPADGDTGPTRAAMAAAAVGVHRLFLAHTAVITIHLLHVLVGVGILAWLLVASVAGTPGSSFATVVRGTGTWWQLVSMTWIFLFALLYLIR